jgi:proteasome activator subunit 4
LSKKKWHDNKIDPSKLINERDIKEFVNSLKDITLTAIFSKSNDGYAQKTFQYLTFLSKDIMVPPLVEKISMSIDSLIDPHRYLSLLSCLILIARELPRLDPVNLVETRTHVLPLMCAVLPGIDSNDSLKCNLTFKFLSNIISCVIVCDCSSAPKYRKDLTEIEKELCYETTKFEDFVMDFFNKIFRLLDNMAFNASSDSFSAMNDIINSNADDENTYLTNMMYTIRVLIRQSSRSILKLILNKFKNHISSNNYSVNSGKVISSMCGCLASTTMGYARTCFETLFDIVYENLKRLKARSKAYETFLKNDRGDIEIQWNLELLAGLMKANGLILVDHIGRINELINWYSGSIHNSSIDCISSCFVNVLSSLTSISSNEFCSVSYDIVYEENDEKDFFKQHFPIRDWGRTADLTNLNMKYHIPSQKEIETALEFANSYLRKSMKFLNDSVLLAKNTNDDNLSTTSTTKEERNRELKYIYHIIYGGSSLLKRPTNQKVCTEHIQNNVPIGIGDSLDKGLGFEMANLTDPSHEYFSLTEKHRSILVNLRTELIEFTIELAEKLISHHSNETTLLMLASRVLATSSVTYGCRSWADYLEVWKNHSSNKTSLQNRLLGKQSNTRVEFIQSVMLQYQYRSFHIHTQLNSLDVRIINTLFKLSTESMYALVRLDSQNQLFTVMSQYPYSNLIVIPSIVSILNKCSVLENDNNNKLMQNRLKGCLYVLENSLIIEQNWHVISAIWPPLLKCQDFEKPSIQTLLFNIYQKGYMGLNSFDNRVQISDNALKCIYADSNEIKLKYGGNGEATKLRLKHFHARTSFENDLIEKTMKELIKIANETQLVWRNQFYRYAAFLFFLDSCKLENRLLTAECVQLFVDALVSENINVRTIGVDVLCIISKMVKFKKQIKSYSMNEVLSLKEGKPSSIEATNPGYRNNNKWLLYDPNFIDVNNSSSSEDNRIWENAKFLDKSFWGYYGWSSEKIKIPSNERGNFNTQTNGFSAAFKPVKSRFQYDGEFVRKFIKLSTIEESKGDEKFDKKKFYLFKSLFRNFGNTDIINNFYENLTALICDKQPETHESSHKLASEMLSGLIRGSKYWSLPELKKLWSKLKPILDLMFENISVENLDLWYTCFSTAYVCLFFLFNNY